MKKIKVLLGLLIIVGLVYVGAVWWSGVKTQERYEEKGVALSAWLATNLPEARVTQQSYERGLFSASSMLRIEVDGEPSVIAGRLTCFMIKDGTMMGRLFDLGATNSFNPHIYLMRENCAELQSGDTSSFETENEEPVHLQVTLNNQASHGPWLGSGFGIAKVHTQLSVDADGLPAEVKSYIESLQIDTVRHYSRDYDMRIAGQPFTKTLGTESIDFQGFNLRLNTHGGRTLMDAAIDIPRLVLTAAGDGDQKISMLLDGISLKSSDRSLESTWNWFLTGSSDWRLKQLELTTDALPGKWVRCDNLSLTSLATLKGTIYGEKDQVVLTCSTNHYEKPLEMKGVLDLSVTNIDTQPLANIFSKSMELLEQAGGDTSDPRVNREMAAYMMEQLPVFFSSEPGYLLNADFHLNGRKVMNLSSEMKTYPISSDEAKMPVYVLLPSKLFLSMAYSVDADLMLNGDPDYGWPAPGSSLMDRMVRDGDNYKIELIYDRGTIKMNGEEKKLF